MDCAEWFVTANAFDSAFVDSPVLKSVRPEIGPDPVSSGIFRKRTLKVENTSRTGEEHKDQEKNCKKPHYFIPVRENIKNPNKEKCKQFKPRRTGSSFTKPVWDRFVICTTLTWTKKTSSEPAMHRMESKDNFFF